MWIEFFAILAIGIICIVLGIQNMKGNISSLHSYHRNRVSEEDKLPFGRLVGIGTIISGISIILYGLFLLLSELFNREIFTVIGTVFMISGLVIGLGISFYAMKKYNRGIF